MPVTVHHNKHKEAYEFLKKHKVGVLATVSPDNDPYAAAIYFTVEPSLDVLFVTKVRTKKADNLDHNNHAMMIVYEENTQTTVQLTGSVTKITDAVEVNRLFTDSIYTSLETSGSDVPPIAKLDDGEYVAYRLKPTQIRMAVFSLAAGHTDVFKVIVPDK